ncbi:hypothetical protein GF407_15745 [candidate division KSB1 bacterium]|nr:hypothetical protein [candidate division KSB1 bacterium]
MMKIALVVITAIHALIHLLGFLKAFHIYAVRELSLSVSKSRGLVWLLAFLLFVTTAVLYSLKMNTWWLFGFLGVIVSQILIIFFWKDAKFGTIVNLIILLFSVYGYSSWSFKSQYISDVREGLQRTTTMQSELLTEKDLAPLPELVQNYLNYVGVVGKPRVKNMRVVFKAQMRSKTQDWFSLEAEQYNFYDQSERLFFLDARVKGLPTQGYHVYKNGQAGMLIKLFSLFPVVDVKGEELFKAETVTLFNDMCFLAPATLVDDNIEWEPLDSTSVKATFTNRNHSISATLYFNDKDQLVNFISDDRYDVNEMKRYRFSTPLSEYGQINDYRLPAYGEAVWHYPEGEFTYGKYKLITVDYNVTNYRAVD